MKDIIGPLGFRVKCGTLYVTRTDDCKHVKTTQVGPALLDRVAALRLLADWFAAGYVGRLVKVTRKQREKNLKEPVQPRSFEVTLRRSTTEVTTLEVMAVDEEEAELLALARVETSEDSAEWEFEDGEPAHVIEVVEDEQSE